MHIGNIFFGEIVESPSRVFARDSRNKTRLAKVVIVANSKQKVVSAHKVVKYPPKIFGYYYTLYWRFCTNCGCYRYSIGIFEKVRYDRGNDSQTIREQPFWLEISLT